MPSWLIPTLIIVVIAGIGTGLAVSYFILKRQGGSLPLFEKIKSIELFEKIKSIKIFKKKEVPVQYNTPQRQSPPAPAKEIPTEPAQEKSVREQARSVSLAEETIEKYMARAQSPKPAASQVISPESPAISELESNLEIATRPAGELLVSFQTDIWNTRRSEFHISQQLLGELTEAYVDMLLANNIVWLVTELHRDSPDLRASYADLKLKVAERLKTVLPRVKANPRE
jgi:hypothetical protein